MYIVSNVNIIHGANELASILIRRNFYTRFELIRGIPGTALLFPTNENRLELTTSAPSSQHRINYINEIPLRFFFDHSLVSISFSLCLLQLKCSSASFPMLSIPYVIHSEISIVAPIFPLESRQVFY